MPLSIFLRSKFSSPPIRRSPGFPFSAPLLDVPLTSKVDEITSCSGWVFRFEISFYGPVFRATYNPGLFPHLFFVLI